MKSTKPTTAGTSQRAKVTRFDNFSHLLLTDGQSPMSVTFRGPDDSELWLDMYLQASSGTANPQRHFVGNRDVNILLSSGEQVRLFVFRNGDAGSSALNFYEGTIVGYFVDAS